MPGSGPVQMPLDLGAAPSYAEADFLVAGGNRDAFAAIEGWRSWTAPTRALAGPEGSGKTHLAHLFAARSGGRILPAGALTIDAVPDLLAAGAAVLDDADRGVDERALFHLLNLARERDARLLLTGRAPPARWAVSLADLRSRLAALPIVMIGPPDETLLAALLVKLFADRQLRVEPDLPAYLLPRLERSCAAIRAAVAALDAASLERQRPVTAALARDVLGLGTASATPRDRSGG